jgi:membrane glycosyltransferase
MIFNLQKRRPEGFVRAVTDPYANLVHVGLLRRKIPKSGETRARNKNLQAKMLKEGPASLSPSDRVYLLRNAESMAAHHHGVWQMNNANFVIQRGARRSRSKKRRKESNDSCG